MGRELGIPAARAGGRSWRGRIPLRKKELFPPECQPTQTLHLDIQDPTGFRAYFFVKVGAKVRHLPTFCLLGPGVAVHVLSS